MLARNLKFATRRYAQMTKLTSVRSFASGFEKFNFEDALNLNAVLTDEERMIEEAATQFAQEKLLPRVTESYQKEKFDINIMKEMGEMGFLGCTIPEYGLPGISSTAYGKFNSSVTFL